MNGNDLITAGRRLLSTPFHHQGRTPGVGVDCVGLVVLAAQALGLPAKDSTGYERRPDGVTLPREILANGLIRVDNPRESVRPGDVLVFWISNRQRPQHLAIATDKGMLHTYATVGRVVEHRITRFWEARIWAAFRFPGLEPGTGAVEWPQPGDEQPEGWHAERNHLALLKQGLVNPCRGCGD